MARRKYQRPEVYATGTREKLWKVEYREYFIGADGKEHSRHKAKTWSRKGLTKSEAQAACDKFLAELQGAGAKADGEVTLEQFWNQVYYPLRSRYWTGNTPVAVQCLWRKHIQPQLGSVPLKDITKAMIEIHLGKLADTGLGRVMVDGARVRLYSILEEALDNEYIPKNPARKVETPPCKEPEESRSLSVAEVQMLWDGTTGRDYLIWRLLILTGLRIGELLPLQRSAIVTEGLRVHRAWVNGVVKLPKRNKPRLAAIPGSLRAELEEWLATHGSELIFPSERGKIYWRSAKEIEEITARGRALGIPDLTFRMCRTTFASLFEGDEADRTSIMGHYDTKFTLEHYRKPIQERRQKSVDELDKRLKVVVLKKRA